MSADKQVKIMRGPSGCGKSTLAKKLMVEADRLGQLPIICSADDFFVNAYGYQFDVSKLGDAHKWCLQRYLQFLQDGMNPIIVDNTNINVEDVAPYYAVGEAYGYDVEILQLTTPAEVAIGRNVHGVPDAQVQNMFYRLSRINLPKRWKLTKITP